MMRYAAIDIETTGLNPERCQVLELACVVETDWRTPADLLPTFRRVIWHDEVRGDVRALAMNARLIEEMANGPLTAEFGAAVMGLADFLKEHFGDAAVTFAGKNVGSFDYQFLRRDRLWERVRHKHRFIDVGNLWWEPATDACLPDLAECQRRAGQHPRVAHDAVDDCRAVVECVRAKFRRDDA